MPLHISEHHEIIKRVTAFPRFSGKLKSAELVLQVQGAKKKGRKASNPAIFHLRSPLPLWPPSYREISDSVTDMKTMSGEIVIRDRASGG